MEIDASFYLIKLMEKVGLVWDVRGVPDHVKRKNLLAEVGERCPLLTASADAAPVSEPGVGRQWPSRRRTRADQLAFAGGACAGSISSFGDPSR